MRLSGTGRAKSSQSEDFMNVSRNAMRALFRAARHQARFVASSLLAFGLVAGSVSGAFAEGFAITEWSARGMGLGGGAGGGMVARADDPSAIAYNPAGITQIPGTATQMGLAVSMLNFDISRNHTGKTVSTSDQAWPIPHFYVTHQLNDRVWLGVGAFTRYGLGSQFPDNWTAYGGEPSMQTSLLSSGIKSVTLLSSTINPNLAFKLNDVWSVSAGVSYTWGYLSLNEQYNTNPAFSYATGLGAAHADARIHSENGYAFGYNFGLHARFNDQWSAGLTYRASEDMTFKGSTRFRFSGDPYSVGVLQQVMQNCNADGKLSIPDVITLGVMYKPLPNLSFEGDVAYTVWSRYRNLTINMHGNTPQFFEQKNWRDTWAFTFGVEYAPLDWLTLRAGFTYETSPLQDTNCYDYLVPSNGRNYYTLGAGFKYENWTLDLAYMYIDVRDINYSDRVGTQGGLPMINTYEGRAHNSYAHNFGLTIGYKF